MKTLVLLIGASAVGKSTVRELIVPEPYHKWTLTMGKPLWTVSTVNGWAYLGTGKAGSETIKSLDIFQGAIQFCFEKNDVVVVDTVRISDHWPSMIHTMLKRKNFKILLVHFAITEKENQRRLLERRKRLNLWPFDAKTALRTQEKYRLSTQRAIDAFVKTNIPYSLMTVGDKDTPLEISRAIKEYVK